MSSPVAGPRGTFRSIVRVKQALVSFDLVIMDLIQSLQSSTVEFVAYEALETSRACIGFLGPFLNATVLWNATLVALPRDPEVKQYIDVSPTTREDIYNICIGLKVAGIDEPTVLKAITMVRHYKRLGIGRHEFGG